jgi:hypothetical protein
MNGELIANMEPIWTENNYWLAINDKLFFR